MPCYSGYAMDMQNSITIECNAARAIELKRQLDQDGLVVNEDFDWEWHQGRVDNFSWSDPEPAYVIFRFVNPSLATFYQLKWS